MESMDKVKVTFVAVLFFPLIGWTQTKKASVPAGKGSPLQQAINRGKLVYGVNCLACHQADGYGVGNLNPPLAGISWVTGNKSTLIQMVLKGSQGQVEIDGEKFHNAMPAQAHLTDQQIADVLTYIRNSFGNKASVVTTGEVKAIRAKTK
jgi:mono/diheme cytochrome c family protein